MPVCRKCSNPFPNRLRVGGKLRHLGSRKFCLVCSPLGEHNTSATDPAGRHHCPCGERNPKKFSQTKQRICRKCHAKYTTKRGQENKQRARDYLGGKCQACPFFVYQVALDIHHMDPNKKDPNFNTMRGWKWSRIVHELKKCILLCKNCHSGHHAGFDIFRGVAQPGRAFALGAKDRWFKSTHPDEEHGHPRARPVITLDRRKQR